MMGGGLGIRWCRGSGVQMRVHAGGGDAGMMGGGLGIRWCRESGV